jgi:hypothetical protein
VAVALSCILPAGACASGVSGARAGAGAATSSSVYSREFLREGQFAPRGTLYDAIAAERPEYLQPRSGSTGLGVLPDAYLDGVRLIELDMLRQIPAQWVAEVRYLRAPIASAKFRRDHPAGVIVVKLRPGVH